MDLIREAVAGAAGGVGAALVWAALVGILNVFRAWRVKSTIRRQLSVVNIVSHKLVKGKGDQPGDWEAGYVIQNAAKVEFVVRSIVVEFKAPENEPRHSLNLIYRGELKPDYLDFILLKPQVEGAWLFPIHRLLYREVDSVTVTVEYKSPLGRTTLQKVKVCGKRLEHLGGAFVMHYQRHNPLALPLQLRLKGSSTMNLPAPSSANTECAFASALASNIALQFSGRLDGAPSLPFNRQDKSWSGWLQEITAHLLTDPTSSRYRELAEILAQEHILWQCEFDEAVLQFLCRAGNQLLQSEAGDIGTKSRPATKQKEVGS